MNICSAAPPVCAVGDHVLLESQTEQVKEPLEPAKQEHVVKASQEAGFSTRSMLVNSDQTGIRRITAPFLERPRVAPFYKFSSQRIEVSFLCMDIEVPSP